MPISREEPFNGILPDWVHNMSCAETFYLMLINTPYPLLLIRNLNHRQKWFMNLMQRTSADHTSIPPWREVLEKLEYSGLLTSRTILPIWHMRIQSTTHII